MIDELQYIGPWIAAGIGATMGTDIFIYQVPVGFEDKRILLRPSPVQHTMKLNGDQRGVNDRFNMELFGVSEYSSEARALAAQVYEFLYLDSKHHIQLPDNIAPVLIVLQCWAKGPVSPIGSFSNSDKLFYQYMATMEMRLQYL